MMDLHSIAFTESASGYCMTRGEVEALRLSPEFSEGDSEGVFQRIFSAFDQAAAVMPEADLRFMAIDDEGGVQIAAMPESFRLSPVSEH